MKVVCVFVLDKGDFIYIKRTSSEIDKMAWFEFSSKLKGSPGRSCIKTHLYHGSDCAWSKSEHSLYVQPMFVNFLQRFTVFRFPKNVCGAAQLCSSI